MKFRSESDLAKVVVKWLREDGWDVFQEVSLGEGRSRADLIACKDHIYWGIECKRQMSFELIAQAVRWGALCHISSIAVPTPNTRWGKDHARSLAYDVCEHYGLGILQVGHEVRIKRHPRLNRHPIGKWSEILMDKHRDYAEAGNNYSRFWSPFKQTCEDFVKYVRSNPGCTLKEAVDGIKHHYSSSGGARACLIKWIEKGKINEVRYEKQERAIRLYPKGEESETDD